MTTTSGIMEFVGLALAMIILLPFAVLALCIGAVVIAGMATIVIVAILVAPFVLVVKFLEWVADKARSRVRKVITRA